METKEQKQNEFLNSVHAKACQDEDFKKDLISNPIETLKKFTAESASLGKNRSVIVEDQTDPSHVYLNIPAKPEKFNVQSAEEN